MTDFDDLSFFHDLLDSFNNPVMVADTEHVVRYANKAAEKFYPNGD
jgi:nitrogen-specific signal transduction histidine kinase